jgi:hypothetical protein
MRLTTHFLLAPRLRMCVYLCSAGTFVPNYQLGRAIAPTVSIVVPTVAVVVQTQVKCSEI